MTIDNKRSLIHKNVADPGMTQVQLAEWAKESFRLPKAPARNTVSDILKNADTIMKEEYGKGKRRKPLKVKAPDLERKLKEAEKRGLCLNRKVLIRKAQKLRFEIGGPALEVGLSVGWLTAFMRRHGLRFRFRHGEAGSADYDTVREGRHTLHELTDLYNPADTDPLPVLFIGRAAKPRCFGKKSAEEHGFLYRKTDKAWMNSKVYQEWLLNLDKEMRAAQRHILLFVDNVSSHALKDLVLTNVNVQKLPANTTTFLQPLDAGIIASFKARFKTMHIDRAIALFDAGEDVDGRSVYKIDQLQAMQWSDQLWKTTPASTIAHCWQKAGLAVPVCGIEEDDAAEGQYDGPEDSNEDEDVVDLLAKIASIQL
ncbi:unnamed protein product [Phytophthora lilii]|uniref:Unnamed protein product n=1 Tax=Phytophthora lilii TaxID=2077276 RepID=A0A9W6WUH3_9STRA|nr:unnamed protein product [Phytophthora lilii]